MLFDNHGRPLDYLRLAVTDRCNLRCSYCMPAHGLDWLSRAELLSYEELLRGRDGAEFVVVNAMGKRVSTLGEGAPRAPVRGHDLVLTVDLRVQRAMELAMAKVERGAAVAIDPRTGGILAMASTSCFVIRPPAPVPGT